MRTTLSALGAISFMLAPAAAHAFCGFYVSGADASLYSDATMVVMLREGTRTVLSMQNNYQGPPEDFAMVVPVPVVLQEENVKTLPREIFQRVDSLAAPRLVEYWEQDPCAPQVQMDMAMPTAGAPGMARAAEDEGGGDLGVRIEAQFQVAEYDVVILSARDSNGLDTWLRREQYNIPEGAERVLRPYVEQGTKFFVAKVDVERVQFVNGKAVLSPLRVHYDAPEFWLPVRLGLLNSGGQQDLIMHILSRGTRYEAANYANATIPTNIKMEDAVRHEFGAVYDQLFQRAIEQNPRTVVTEYSWDASSCDPCPTEPLQPQEILTLGADVIPGTPQYGFVLTRLHYRYEESDLGEDIVFRAAGPIVGGRGMPDQEGNMQEQGAQPGSINNFQGRYVILHEWEGPIACATPNRGSWGGPPSGSTPQPIAATSRLSGGGAPTGSQANLGMLVAQDIPELGITQGVPTEQTVVVDRGPSQAPPAAAAGDGGGCASCDAGGNGAPWGAAALAAFVLGVLLFRRRI